MTLGGCPCVEFLTHKSSPATYTLKTVSSSHWVSFLSWSSCLPSSAQETPEPLHSVGSIRLSSSRSIHSPWLLFLCSWRHSLTSHPRVAEPCYKSGSRPLVGFKDKRRRQRHPHSLEIWLGCPSHLCFLSGVLGLCLQEPWPETLPSSGYGVQHFRIKFPQW